MNKTKLILFFIITSCLVTTSCQIVEKIIDPVKKERIEIVEKVYEKDGLSISYPDNWQITEDTVTKAPKMNAGIGLILNLSNSLKKK